MADYPFVRAKWFTRNGMEEPRAILWHMAEGGGTVSWFTHVRTNVSSHYVVETSGRIVQMVRDSDASHSAHVSIDPNDADANDCGIYDPAVARSVLGGGWADINAYVLAVEVEGFRKDGPNAKQSDAIEALAFDLYDKHPTIRGNIGHRDVQDYKSCPGCFFPWARVGGHGLLPSKQPREVTDMAVQLPPNVRSDYKLDAPVGTPFWLTSDLRGKPRGELTASQSLDYFGAVVGDPSRAVRLVTGTPYGDRVARPTLCYVREDLGVPRYEVQVPGDCEAAVAAVKASARIVYE